jgi:hypothetical protein
LKHSGLPCGPADVETGIVLVHAFILPRKRPGRKGRKAVLACNVSGNSAERTRCDNKSSGAQGDGLDARVNPDPLPVIFHAADYFVARYLAETREGWRR